MDSVCSLTLYRGVVVPSFKTAAATNVSPSLDSPPPSHPSSTRLPPPPRPLSSDVVASFSPFRSLYRPQPVALLMCACLRERRSRVYKRPRGCVRVCVNTYTDGNVKEGRRKKEERRKEEKSKQQKGSGEGGGRKGGKK